MIPTLTQRSVETSPVAASASFGEKVACAFFGEYEAFAVGNLLPDTRMELLSIAMDVAR